MSTPSRSHLNGSRRARRPALAIVLLIAFMAVVFWFIIERQLRGAEERRLRLLAGFADRVEATVGDLGDRFARVVTGRCADQVEEYLELLPQVAPIETTEATAPCSQPGTPGDDGEQGARHRLSLLTGDADIRLEYRREVAEGIESTGDLGTAEPRAVGKARARLELESIIEPMIIPGVFDSILLADAGGKILYQQGEPELRVTHLEGLVGGFSGARRDGQEDLASWKTVVEQQGGDAGRFLLQLLRMENATAVPSDKGGLATALLETQIASSDHTVFVQPVTLRLSPLEDGTAPEAIRWLAVGVISSEHLLSAGVTTSPILLFLLVSILPLGLVVWPFLKLALISRRQPLTRLDTGFLVVSCVLALSFGALLLFDALFLANVQDTVDRQLEELSDSIHGAFRLELFDAHRQLQELNSWVQDPEAGGRFNLAESGDYFDYLAGRGSSETDEASATQEDCPSAPEDRTAENFIRCRIGHYLGSSPSLTYPAFDAVFWPDQEGRLDGANLPLRPHAVLPQEVTDREYFRCAKEWKNPLTLTPSDEEPKEYLRTRGIALSERSIQLCLQSFLDRATGEAVTALSVPGPEAWKETRPVAALVTRLTSVTHPVLPAQIHFAIVDRAGQVLFHSDSRRALTEDFLKATDEDRLLQSLMEAERKGHLPLHYWGGRNRAYVRPIEDLPWTLVIFRNMEDLRLRNFELIYDFLNPFVLSLLIPGLLLLGLKLGMSDWFRKYVWPTPEYLWAYQWIVWWTLALAGLFLTLLVLYPASRVGLFWAAFLVIPATTVFVICLVMLGRQKKFESGKENDKTSSQDQEETKSKESWIFQAMTRLRELGSRASRTLTSHWIGGSRQEETPGESEPPGNSGPANRDPRELGGSSGRGAEESEKDPRPNDEASNRGTTGPETIWQKRFESLRRAVSSRSHVIKTAVATVAGLVGLSIAWSLLWGSGLGVAWLVLVLTAIAFAWWHLRFEFEGERRKTGYVFALGCLLLLTLLPTLAFFHLARSRQTQLMTQEGTLELARAVRERTNALDAREGPLESYYTNYQNPLACTRDSYLEPLFGARIHAGVPPTLANVAGRRACRGGILPPRPERESDRGLWPFGPSREGGPTDSLEGLMFRTFSARPLALNDLSSEPRGVDLSRFETTLGDWSRLDRESDRNRILFDPEDGPSRKNLPVLASTLPSVHSIQDVAASQKLLLSLGFLLLAGTPFALSWFLAKKLFLIDLVYYGEAETATDKKSGELRESVRRLAGGGDALDEVLEEVRKSEKQRTERSRRGGGGAPASIKRLVLISGQLQREAWEEHVIEATPSSQTDSADEDGATTSNENEPPRFWEARFREAWIRTAGADESAEDMVTSPDLAPATGRPGPASRAEGFAAFLVEGDSERRPVLLTEFDPDLEDPVVAGEQTDALRHLVEHEGRTLVILAEALPARAPEDGPEAPEAVEARSRWVELLGSFPVRYARDTRGVESFQSRLDDARRLLPDESDVETRGADRHKSNHLRHMCQTIEEECTHTQPLRQLGQRFLTEYYVELRRDRLTNSIETLTKAIEDLDKDLELSDEIRKLQDEQSSPGLTAGSPAFEEAKNELEKKWKELHSLRQRPAHATEDPTAEAGDIDQLETDPLPEDDRHKKKKKKTSKETEKELKKRELGRIEASWGDIRTLLTEQHLITRVGAEARLHYRHLWWECTRDEKLVLVQLAHNGIVNPKYSGWVLDLMQKGLVIRAPDVRIMNQSFARFVRQETRRSQILNWQEELGPNAWSLLKWILPFPLLALAGFLFITQRDAVSNAAGILVALVSLTPVVFNLYDKFQEINLRHSKADSDAEAAGGS